MKELPGDSKIEVRPPPPAKDMAQAHVSEIRRLAHAMSIEQLQLSRMLCGRKVRPIGKSGPTYRIELVTFNSGGSPLIHGCLLNRRRKHQLGDLNAVEFV